MIQTNIGSKPSPKKRKRRRRIHRGRLSLLMSIVAFVVIVIMVILSRCSDGAGTVFRAGGDFRKPIPTAIEAGREDAKRVLMTAPESMERDNSLLYIKSRESRLRMSGYSHAADDYINSATDFLRKKGVINNGIK